VSALTDLSNNNNLLLSIEVQLLFHIFIMEGLNEYIPFNLKLGVFLQI
jgi:hypothetical protein